MCNLAMKLTICAALAAAAFPMHAASNGMAAAYLLPNVRVDSNGAVAVDTQVWVSNRDVDPIALNITALESNTNPTKDYPCKLPNRNTIGRGRIESLNVARDCNVPASFSGALMIEPDLSTPLMRAPNLEVRAQGSIGNGTAVEFPITSIALNHLPGRSTTQQIDDLASDSANALSTSCNLAAGNGSNKLVGELKLLDGVGSMLGRAIPIKLEPRSVLSFGDIFAEAGLSGTYRDVRAQLSYGAGDDVGSSLVCTTVRRIAGGISITTHAGVPLEGASLTRMHQVLAEQTLGGMPLTVKGTQNALHYLFVRHQDVLSCTVLPIDPSTDPSTLLLSAVAPYRSKVIGGSSHQIKNEDTGTRGSLGRGIAGAWGLIVELSQPSSGMSIDYRLQCETGNGSNAPNVVIVTSGALPRP
jgi:hypothetical protein